MEKLYWDTINFNDKKLYFTVNNNGLNFISDSDQRLSQIYDFYPKGRFEFRNQRNITRIYVEQFDDFILGERKQLTLPFDISGAGNSTFQKIWQLIKTIPYGSIMTVQDVAQHCGVDDQTVIHALSATPLPMIIPVHRVIYEPDMLFPVRGGAAMRSQLLEMEAMNGLDDIE
ncbi:methylated-DNA--[protein]-cysteine S-methyltransferase [Lactobacillus sp. Sy-1]|uniref:methylated-DNA--[protein]-cysteine S-methyltransferase n=1 Tax=Lactobacillus sp. Sy-1 TaxID=2109645 RepID=UPI001C55C704|nr:methylated-DNA--[protein]-cysteine S-methyltransferase [Lactobacillus sp. Sy-1]MBW1605138.1 methylated-DNA--[protein]-cysteine S-methyltransferase [Lactobacillus sp. Sy-1]